MVEFRVKVGPKGQILIPKALRDEYGIEPRGMALLRERAGGMTGSWTKK